MVRRVGAQHKSLYLLAGIVIISLIGVQLYWMVTSVRLQQLTAERNLKNDLNKVIKEVEESAYCFYYNSKAYIKKGEGIYIIKQQHKDGNFLPPPAGTIDTLSLYNVFFFQKDTVFDKNSAIT